MKRKTNAFVSLSPFMERKGSAKDTRDVPLSPLLGERWLCMVKCCVVCHVEKRRKMRVGRKIEKEKRPTLFYGFPDLFFSPSTILLFVLVKKLVLFLLLLFCIICFFIFIYSWFFMENKRQMCVAKLKHLLVIFVFCCSLK